MDSVIHIGWSLDSFLRLALGVYKDHDGSLRRFRCLTARHFPGALRSFRYPLDTTSRQQKALPILHDTSHRMALGGHFQKLQFYTSPEMHTIVTI